MVPRRLCWIVWLLLWHSNGPAAGASGACASTVGCIPGCPGRLACRSARLTSISDPQGAQDVHRRAQAAGAGEARPLERPLPACADLGGRAVPQGLPPGAFGPSEILGVAPLVGWSGGSASLHTLVYAGDFVGFRALLAVLSRNENFPHLLTALQSNDERVRRRRRLARHATAWDSSPPPPSAALTLPTRRTRAGHDGRAPAGLRRPQ